MQPFPTTLIRVPLSRLPRTDPTKSRPCDSQFLASIAVGPYIMPNARLLALQLLTKWDHSQRHAQDLLGEAFQDKSIQAKDKPLVQHLVFGVLRQRRLLDKWIWKLRKGKLDDDTRRILQLGLFQLFHTRVPDHAAVNETLRLASSKTRGLANAILRRATREREALEKLAIETSPAVRFSLPDFLYDKWLGQFGKKETEKLCQWCQEPAPIYFRRNELHPESLKLCKDQGLKRVKVGERDDFYQIDEIPQMLLDGGVGYIQDPATLLACDLLGVKSGHRVLDAFAAPGGKTAYLTQVMGNEGTLIATDTVDKRLERLRENLQRLGVKRPMVKQADWSEPHPELELFDRILLDVPCSNTGVLRRRVDLRWRLAPEVFAEMAELQFTLASNALKQLRPGGRAVYSTCSIEPEENEQLVDRLLKNDPSLDRREVVTSMPQTDGFDGAFATLLVKRT